MKLTFVCTELIADQSFPVKIQETGCMARIFSRRGQFVHLTAIHLTGRVSNTLEPDFRADTPEEDLGRFEKSVIVGTDRGSRFTSLKFAEFSQPCASLNRTELITATLRRGAPISSSSGSGSENISLTSAKRMRYRTL